MRRIILISCQFFSLVAVAIAQTIAIDEWKITNNDVTFTYSVSKLEKDSAINVQLFIKADSGSNYVPLMHVTGDIDTIKSNGKYKIAWVDMRESPMATGEEYLFKVKIKDKFYFRQSGQSGAGKEKKHLFVAYAANMTAPFGLRAGKTGGIGWYAKIQFNSKPFLESSYTYEDQKIVDYDKFAWYQFTSEHAVSAFNICGGATFSIPRLENLNLYAGAGYGKEDCFYEYEETSYETNQLTGTYYAKDETLSASGIELEGGAIYCLNKLLITGGFSSTSFKTLNLELGIGLKFK
jgi:hypothetical protein